MNAPKCCEGDMEVESYDSDNDDVMYCVANVGVRCASPMMTRSGNDHPNKAPPNVVLNCDLLTTITRFAHQWK